MHFKFDIISLNETFLRGNTCLQLNGYSWFGNNRTNIHRRAVRGSGGVGILVKSNMFEIYDVTVIDKEYEGILGVKFIHKVSGYSFIVFSAYLPPENSVRGTDSDTFFAHLMGQLYIFEDVDAVYICGDFNSRICDENDCVDDIDCIPRRQPIDIHGNVNIHGQSFLEFLKDAKLCVINGRVCKDNDDFTSVSSKGQAVVDYFVVPHDVLQNCLYFKVHTMRNLIDDLKLHTTISDPRHIPDHSLLSLKCYIRDMDLTCNSQSDYNVPHALRTPTNQQPDSDNLSFRKYKRNVPADFLQNEESRQNLVSLIDSILSCRNTQNEIDQVYDTFCKFYHEEMNEHVGYSDLKIGKKHKFKSKPKPWWNEELNVLWKNLVKLEKELGSTTNRKQKKSRCEQFRKELHNFDKVYRRYKRRYTYEQQLVLETINAKDPKQFWQYLEKLGPRSSHVNKNIPEEVYSENGDVLSDRRDVLDTWADNYSSLYSPYSDSSFDDVFYNTCIERLYALESTILQNSNPELNEVILLGEVDRCVQSAKYNKAVGLDNLPYEIFKNETSVDLLTKLFNLIFESGMMPTVWLRAVIKPIPKSSMTDPRIPLQYRGISLLSTVSKLYTSFLNTRLLGFCENNEILVEEQNGFRKKRSCEEHLFSLSSIIRNRIHKRDNTFTAFIDMEKAFDKVDRKLLLLKLLEYGIDGNMYKAIRSLCINTMYTVNVNGYNTKWFDAALGVRQGDCISPTLFSLFINDMAVKIKELRKGIQFGDINVSLLLYADDLVLIANNENDLQQMLNTVTDWCQKWRLKTSTLKSKVIHFRHSSIGKTEFDFKLSGQSIECVDKYKYLGIIFDEHLTFKNTAQLLSDSGGRALGKVLSKMKKLKGFGYETYTKLYGSYVDPILLYGAGVWGYNNFSVCETIQNRAIRAFLGVHRFAPNLAIWGDMGWLSTQNKRHECMLRLWNRFVNMNNHRLCKQIFLHDVHLCSGNWSSEIYKIFSEVNMIHLFENLESADIPTIKDIKHEYHKDFWETNRHSTPKLRTYNTFKYDYCVENYVKVLYNRGHKSVMAQFRSGILPLKVETGRFTGIPWHFRICELCNTNEVEDEYHFMMICTCYSNERDALFSDACNSYPDFMEMELDVRFFILMNDEDLTHSTAKFLYNSYMKRKSIMYS